ncbi:ATP-binding protein [Streptomyces gamaensis]|uniref:ATP-binding protein n=1 Tax=Streptomyces gamaensis TaxID=1763542 RepID=A0ABW0Z9P8_9ACTN
MTPTARPRTGALLYTETMERVPTAARRARLLVSRALRTWGLGELVEPTQLIVSELVTNAVLHAHGPTVRVAVSRPATSWLRVAVVDNSRAHPRPRAVSADDRTGRGLAIVDALADRWGTDSRERGKQVWAELLVRARPGPGTEPRRYCGTCTGLVLARAVASREGLVFKAMGLYEQLLAHQEAQHS